MFSYNFKYYLLLPILMSIPSRRFRLWVMRKYHVTVGKDTIVCRRVSFRNGKNIQIGENCVINSNTLLDGRGGVIRIGNHVDIAQDSIIWTLEHDIHTHESIGGDVIIEDYCWIGCRVMIKPGVHIGEGSICAAYAVITKDIESNAIYGGVPARKISDRNRTRDYILAFNSKYR